ncbi:MAG: LysM peptidoglycan-binding domain-containing protein [Chthoniobacterales bacterium]|nr:LysM peptidoglycan-binding domain-containing protein [Chthoniobacterales bacterium]
MKIPKFLLKKPAKKKLRASTARRSINAPDEMEYEEMSEPNMKLSRALLIVLVLHVVAVAGIIAFNTIKSRQGVLPHPPETVATPSTENAPSAAAKMDAATSVSNAVVTSVPQAKPAPSEVVLKAEPVKSAAASNESGNFYVVAKGDNPVKIAKKLKVSEAELLAVNHIDDPRKLQIGQKLIVPAKKTTSKKNEN